MPDQFRELTNEMNRSPTFAEYCERHGIDAAPNLTVTNDERAGLVADHLYPRLKGKTVVEIGGGLGLLAFHISEYAERVFVIEANPAWASVYVNFLHSCKPRNLTFIFGAADEVAGLIRGDIAYFCTHSGVTSMANTAAKFAPEVIDVYGEILSDRDDGQTMALAQLRYLNAAKHR
jgi:hypothetical protein